MTIEDKVYMDNCMGSYKATGNTVSNSWIRKKKHEAYQTKLAERPREKYEIQKKRKVLLRLQM